MSINKNGTITSKDFSDVLLSTGMITKVLSDNSVWARIHWLDVSSTKEYFANAAEVAKCLNKTNRYSMMEIVDQFKTAAGVYEFMLTYPSLSSTLYNRWTQTSSPNASSVTGFTAITTAWSAHNYGLRKHETLAIYDCDSGDTWFTPIGQLTAWDSAKSIPAADGSNQTSTELWVRVDNIPTFKQVSINNDIIISNNFIEI